MASTLDEVTPTARDFIRSGLGSLRHAYDHADKATAGDSAQVIMSLAHAAEMLTKAAILHKGESIHIPNRAQRTITLREALDRIQKPRHAATMLVLVDRRDSIQHAAAYMDPETVGDYVETTRSFVHDLLLHVFGIPLEDLLPLAPAEREARVQVGGFLDPADALQRDASYGGGVTVWAQGELQHNRLRIRVREPGGEIRWLTPPDEFEYMPHTDGRHVVAYRQSGGIILYDLGDSTRRVLHETGGPGAIEGGVIAVQGIGITEGLGGGVFLLAPDGGLLRRVSEAGDSPRLSKGLLVWQEFRDDQHLILCQRIDSHDISTLVVGGRHPAVHGDLLAWTDVGSRPQLRARNLGTAEERILSEAAIFPDVRNGLIAFLEHSDATYDLKVFDWERKEFLFDISDVGFPTGRGPLVTDTEVVWEAQLKGAEARLYYQALPMR